MDKLFKDIEQGIDDGHVSLFEITPEFCGVTSYAVLPEFDMRAALDSLHDPNGDRTNEPFTHVTRAELGDTGFADIRVTDDGQYGVANVCVHALVEDRRYIINYGAQDFDIFTNEVATVAKKGIRRDDLDLICLALCEEGVDRFFADKFEMLSR